MDTVQLGIDEVRVVGCVEVQGLLRVTSMRMKRRKGAATRSHELHVMTTTFLRISRAEKDFYKTSVTNMIMK